MSICYMYCVCAPPYASEKEGKHTLGLCKEIDNEEKERKKKERKKENS